MAPRDLRLLNSCLMESLLPRKAAPRGWPLMNKRLDVISDSKLQKYPGFCLTLSCLHSLLLRWTSAAMLWTALKKGLSGKELSDLWATVCKKLMPSVQKPTKHWICQQPKHWGCKWNEHSSVEHWDETTAQPNILIAALWEILSHRTQWSCTYIPGPQKLR